jgi:hypothetical protein
MAAPSGEARFAAYGKGGTLVVAGFVAGFVVGFVVERGALGGLPDDMVKFAASDSPRLCTNCSGPLVIDIVVLFGTASSMVVQKRLPST